MDVFLLSFLRRAIGQFARSANRYFNRRAIGVRLLGVGLILAGGGWLALAEDPAPSSGLAPAHGIDAAEPAPEKSAARALPEKTTEDKNTKADEKKPDESLVDFNRDIRPLLSDRCFHCHGPAENTREADLRFDTEEGAMVDLGGYHAIDREAPAESELMARLLSKDEDEVMPPAEINKPLSAQEIDLFRRWIEQGAPWADHWAYVAPKRSEAEIALKSDWPGEASNDQPVEGLDRLVLARLEAEGLRPSPEADRVTLIRRLSFDLRGLPPTPAEVKAFVEDASPEAYEKLVDRMLASPQFGERMAMWWLDLVRFADSVGYHGDQPYRSWPYRDYVINAFNRNLPFDQFTVENLAGDLLPEPTQDQLVATCYNRLLQTSHEGGVQLKEYRSIYLADRVRNVSQVWMGATVGCSQCHDHKYDPYTAKDFYALGAFFADVDDEEHIVNNIRGLNTLPSERLPEMPVITRDIQAKIDSLSRSIDQLEEDIASIAKSNRQSQAEWERSIERPEDDATRYQETLSVNDKLLSGGESVGKWDFISSKQGPVHQGEKSRKQSYKRVRMIQHFYEKAAKPFIVREGDTLFSWVYLDPKNPPPAVMLQVADEGHSWDHRAVWGSDDLLSHRLGMRDGKREDWDGYRRQGELPPVGKWVRLEVKAEDLGFAPGDLVTGMSFTQFSRTAYWDTAGLRREIAPPKEFYEAIATDSASRSESQRRLIRDWHKRLSPEIQAMQAKVEPLRLARYLAARNAPKVMYTKALKKPRDVRLLPRGNWLDESGPIIEPAIPEFLGTLKVADRRATRLDLAKWLVSPEAEGGMGEYTARVQANRFWYLMMGSGISRVLDDFGGQGEPPVHPELLDELGREFFDSGWDVKGMMKHIAMSRTYRQASLASEKLRTTDPNNRLYARQSRPRLPAEMIRDNALSISGLLVDQIGGPSVKPYQPGGYYRHFNFPKRKYEQHSDERQWRRGLYVHWQRQFLHPMLKAFDAPSREECTAERPQSNTPVAALTLLNDPTFVESARAFAERILREGGPTEEDKLRFAFLHAASRSPDETERATLSDLLSQSEAYYTKHEDDAKRLLGTGLKPADKELAPAKLAAWTMVARSLLNMNETITRN